MHALYLYQCPPPHIMGIGKTKDFIQPESMASDAKGFIPVVITPTKALTKGVRKKFSSSHYIDDVTGSLL